MRLTPEEMKQLPSPFCPSQARALAGVENSRLVVIVKPDNTHVFCQNDDPVTISTGDEVELLPAATSRYPGDPVGMSDEINSSGEVAGPTYAELYAGDWEHPAVSGHG